ncbi:hypothetical protein SAMN04515668_2544 [Hymenobacter arizonensis]|uniref:Uncharacterized protein n=1 Tax=Hymenobacter arizonensis TaxID=1227077 RepID=A0A1I5YYW3_HYMAR|nr:hypothetical protein SAMN04515668_2544 [Hymenobacter arizonensis]
MPELWPLTKCRRARRVVDLRLRTITLAEDGAFWMKACEPGSLQGTIGLDGAGTGVAAVCPQ